MAGRMKVTIDSGPLDAEYCHCDVPKQQWPELIKLRKHYIDSRFYLDCRYLVQFVNEAEQMWEPLGYKDINDLIQHGLGLDPDEVWLARDWLAIIDPDNPVTFPEAVAAGRRLKAMVDAKNNPDPPESHGGDRKSKEYRAKVAANQPDKKGKRPVDSGEQVEHYGNSNSARIKRLRKHHPDIAQRLENGEFKSVAAAVRVAQGLPADPPRKKATALERVMRLLPQLTSADRRQLLKKLNAQEHP